MGSPAPSSSAAAPDFALTTALNTYAQYSLAAAVSPYGAGTMTLNPPGGWYNSGTVVQVSAAPAAGYTFTGFTGNLTGNVLPQMLVMNGNKSVTANFAQSSPSLTIATASPLPNGSFGVPYSQTLAATGGTPPYTW